MADNKSVLTVSIVTPDGNVYDRNDVKLLILKTKGGQMGIMANHVPVIASLEVDAVKIENEDNSTDIVAVNGGFVEFSNNTATIVADSAEKSNQIDVDRANRAKDRAQHELDVAREQHDEDSAKRAAVALQRAVNRINVAKK